MHTGRIWGFSVEKWRTESHKKNVKYSSISGGQTLTPCKSPLGSSRKVPPTLFGYPWGRTTSWANNLSLVLRVPFPLLFPGARQQQLTICGVVKQCHVYLLVETYSQNTFWQILHISWIIENISKWNELWTPDELVKLFQNHTPQQKLFWLVKLVDIF